MTYVTRLVQYIHAPRAEVYRALVDPEAIAAWRVPDGMTSVVHTFDPREGGSFRISLTYDSPDNTGKTTASTDTYQGHFVRLRSDEQVVEVMEFESPDPSLRGEMTLSITLTPKGEGTEVLAVHGGVPDAIQPELNELGWKISLGKLARLVEEGVEGG